MSHMQYHSDTDNTAACMGQARHDVKVEADTSRTDLIPWRDHSVHLGVQSATLQMVAASIRSGISPLQFMAGINAGSRQMGNRAFLRWVGELQAAGRESETYEVAAQGSSASDRPLTRLAPLQFMPKKKKKTGEAAAEVAEALPEATPEAGAATVPEPQATVPQAEPGATAPSGEKKKKKKSRVQVALNTLRAEGVEEFGRYIHAEIGETALLHTLTERITRAQDLGDKKDPALKVVEARLGKLDLEGVPAAPQAAAAGQWQVAEKAVVAPIKTALNIREKELFECCFEGNAGRFKHLVRHRMVDINMGSQYGTFLCLAAFMGNTVIVKELLSIPGIDVNLAHQTGSTPLCFAAQQGHIEVVKLLLARPGLTSIWRGQRGQRHFLWQPKTGMKKL